MKRIKEKDKTKKKEDKFSISRQGETLSTNSEKERVAALKSSKSDFEAKSFIYTHPP